MTITINHGSLNGYAYVQRAETLADLESAPKESITIVPANGVDNGGSISLTDSAATMFYKIGVQAEVLPKN